MTETTEIRYRTEENGEWKTAVMRGDWVSVCNKVRDRLFPELEMEHFKEKRAS